MNFSWRLFKYNTEETGIDFINLNPSFYSNKVHFSLEKLESNIQDNHSQNTQDKYVDSQEGTNWLGNLLAVSTFTGLLIYGYMNPSPSEDRYLNNVLEKYREEEKLYKRIMRNYHTNY